MACYVMGILVLFSFFFSSRRRHTRLQGDWSSDVCSSDLLPACWAILKIALPWPPEALICLPRFLPWSVACQKRRLLSSPALKPLLPSGATPDRKSVV